MEKTARLEMRLTQDAKSLIQQAAELANRSLSEFITGAAVEKAQKEIADQMSLRLDREQSIAFAERLLEDREPSKNLKRAAARHQEATA